MAGLSHCAPCGAFTLDLETWAALTSGPFLLAPRLRFYKSILFGSDPAPVTPGPSLIEIKTFMAEVTYLSNTLESIRSPCGPSIRTAMH